MNSSSDVFLTNRRCSTTTEWHWSGATNQGAASLKGDDALNGEKIDWSGFMKKIYKDIKIFIDGIGLVLYSDEAMNYVKEGENFFEKEFSTPNKVAEHIQKGDIVGFCTGTSGEFNVKVRDGYPNNDINEKFPISIRLALDVKGNTLSIIDLSWLMEWSNDVPTEQQIILEEGVYHLTILTRKPDSGIWGDNQDIYIYMNKIDKMPLLNWNGVPQLFVD